MNQTRSSIDCLCLAVLLSCIVYGLFGCFFCIVDMGKAANIIKDTVSVVILFAVLCSFLYYSKESARIGVPVIVILIGFLAWINREQVMTCLTVIAEHVLLRLDRYYGMGWKINENARYLYSKPFQKGLFILVLIITFLLSIDVAGFIRAKWIFALSILILVFGMCVGRIPSGFYVILLLIGLFGLFSMTSKSRDFHTKWRFGRRGAVEICCNIQQEEREALIHSGQKAAIFTIGCFFASLLIGTVFQKQFGEELFGFHKSVKDWANKIEYHVLHYDYGQLLSGNLSVPNQKEGSQGQLSNAKIHYSGREVLRLTTREVPKKAIYLRGFVGKDYQGDHWSAVDGQELSQMYSSWEAKNNKKMEQDIGNLTYDIICQKMKLFIASEIKIDYMNAPGRYAYLPYYTHMGDFLEIDGDGMVYLQEKAGEERIKSLDIRAFWRNSGKYYENLAVSFLLQTDIDRWDKTMQKEERYREYVKKQYLDVPDTISRLKFDCKKLIRKNTKNAASLIRKYLNSHAVYSMDLKPVPQGEDFIEYFLYTQKKGYCVHFATAAVLMYRLFNIPARFVEGYVVWPEDFVYNEDGTYTASIPDSRAHAWAEVYYEGFGFIPVDMTPSDGIAGGLGNSGLEGEPEMYIAEEKDKKDSDSTTVSDKKKNQEKEESGTKDKKKKKEKDDLEENSSGELKSEQEEKQNKKGKEIQNGTGTGSVQKEEREQEEVSIAIERVLDWLRFLILILSYFAAAAVFLMAWNIFYRRRKYKKNQKKLLWGIKDKKREEVIRASCRFHGYLKISGMEKAWHKLYGKNISDREYEEMVKRELIFLENNEYHRFRETVQKALYCPPEIENAVSDRDVEECTKFSGLVRKYLFQRLPWYKRILINGVVK